MTTVTQSIQNRIASLADNDPPQRDLALERALDIFDGYEFAGHSNGLILESSARNLAEIACRLQDVAEEASSLKARMLADEARHLAVRVVGLSMEISA